MSCEVSRKRGWQPALEYFVWLYLLSLSLHLPFPNNQPISIVVAYTQLQGPSLYKHLNGLGKYLHRWFARQITWKSFQVNFILFVMTYFGTKRNWDCLNVDHLVKKDVR